MKRNVEVLGATMVSLTTQNLGKVTLLRCAGRIVAGDEDRLRYAVLTHRYNRIVVLDLAEVSAMDAAGLGMLISLRAWASATGKELRLLNLTPRVQAVLELTNLMSAFEVCSVREMMEILCLLTDQALLHDKSSAFIYMIPEEARKELPSRLNGS